MTDNKKKESFYLSCFSEAVKRFPDKKALFFKEKSYTYAELDALTDRLAALLLKEGAGRGEIVPVLVPRSEYMTITALGILKTGAAYEPLDASHPEKRIRAMVEEAGASLVIVSKDYMGLIPDTLNDKPVRKILMEDIEKLPAADGPGSYDIAQDDVFVILYTSGSTGVPKGIMLTQHNISVLLSWYLSYYEVDENCRMGEHPSFVFDLAILESLLPLASGASVHIIPEEIRTDLLELGRFFDENKITHVTMTTQLGRQFAMNVKCSSLKHLTVGGEALVSVKPPEGYTLHNGYGPAECTAFVTMFPVLEDYPEKVPLGNPMPDVDIYILDSEGKKVRDGEIGELCIAGPHVSPGYLNHDDLTGKVFTDNPFSEDPEYKKMYHTGDLARIMENGLIEYMGRADRQIKIRGFRIEPAEIEALIKGFEGIQDVLVISFGSGEGKSLCAYYASEEPVDEDRLSELVASSKPSYMVPSCFIHLKEFPLNVNGKIDRQKLPVPEMRKNTGEYRAPQNDTEKKLAELFEQILSVERTGAGDDFFRLGGNSISAATLLFRIYETFSVKPGIRDIMEHPVVSDLADCILKLKESSDIKNSLEEAEIKALPKQDDYAVSSSQERIYTAQSLLPEGDPSYCLGITVSTDGAFDRERVIQTLKQLFIRHESLRTSFHITKQGLRQRISGTDAADIEEAIKRAEEKSLFEGDFDLGRAPLFSWRFGAEKLRFEWHHIISDGRSNVLFAREFMSLYNGEILEPLLLHQKEYADFEGRLKGLSVYQKRSEAFKRLAEGFADAEETQLITDAPFKSGAERPARHLQSVLNAEFSERIDRLCREYSVTPYMFLLTVYSVFLHFYTGKEELILGTVMDGRNEGQIDMLQGMFVNTVPLFVKVTDTETFPEVLYKVRDTVLFAIDNQSVSLEEVVSGFSGAGGFERTSHDRLLFDMLFVMQSLDRQLPGPDGKNAVLEFDAGERAMYDLTLEAEKIGSVYHFDLEYDSSLFSEENMRYAAGHFETLLKCCLKSVTDGKDALKISELSMIDEEERKTLLQDFQPAPLVREDRADTKVTDLIIDRAKEDPERTAVIFGDEALSYRELCERAFRLAGTIMKTAENDPQGANERRGVVFAKRCPSMIVSILGTLFSGCAYVPVSPEYPLERIIYLLKDSAPSFVVTASAALPEEALGYLAERGIPVMDCDTVTEEAVCVNEQELRDSIRSGESAAYMIYTSGTTGEPKGVVVEHRQLSALLCAYDDIYRLTRDDVVLQFADFVFDQSVWDIFHILTVGGALCLVPEEVRKDPEVLADYCEKHGVSAASLTPGYLRLLEPEAFKSLRLLDVGGEAPDRRLLREWAPGRTVFNTYGPTETTVNATSFLFSRDGVLTEDLIKGKNNVPIGKPVPGTRVYILNGDRLCPVSVAGELCISGDQVAREYFGRRELTEEKFCTDPFFGGRMYRTGDMARFLPDGNLEFAGRFDDQVKLRGFRIELTEIEAVLRSLDGIKDGAVLIKKSKTGEDVLCGYYVAEKETPISAEEIRTLLEERLPSYMVPGFLMPLEKLPVTINGKLDKRALPVPEGPGEAEYIAADGEKEQELVSAFSEILNLDRVSVTSDFLSMGGDSIKAIRIASLLRRKGYQADAGMILKYRTIRRIAPGLEKAGHREYREFTEVRKTPVMLQFEKAEMPEPSWYNQSVMLLLKDKYRISFLEEAIGLLVKLHGMLRMAAACDAGRGEAIMIRESAQPKLTVFNELSERERDEAATSIAKNTSPKDGRVIQAALFVNHGEQRLFLTIHHYAVDEVSWSILLDDLSFILESKREGRDPAETEKSLIERRTASFGEWAKYLWEYRDSEDFLPGKAFWEGQHKRLDEGSRSLSEWLKSFRRESDVDQNGQEDARDADSSKTPQTGHRFGRIRRLLPTDTAKGLLAAARKRYHSKADAILLAALMRALRQLGAPEKIIFQLESHGRGDSERLLKGSERLEISHTVGWFTAVYPLLVQSGETADEQVINVKEALIRIPDQGIGYGLLYDDISDLSPFVFNYLGESRAEAYDAFLLTGEPCGEEMAPENGDPGTISFDLRITDEGLSVECTYDPVFNSEMTGRLFEQYIKELSELSLMAEKEGRVYGPGDLCRGTAMEMKDWNELTSLYPPEKLDAVARLTPLQQGMLYRYITEPESRTYYLEDRLSIKGRWDRECFKEALRLLSVRHDALRLRFVYNGLEEPWQVILKEQVPEYEEQDRTIEEAAKAERKRGVSLLDGPVMRFVKCKGNELLIVTHHCILDGWSFQTLIKDLMRYYKELLEGVSYSELNRKVLAEREQNPSFADYLSEQSLRNAPKSLIQWEKYLEGVEEGSAPDSFRLKRSKVMKGKKAEKALSPLLCERIKAYTSKHHITASSFFGVLWGLQMGFECFNNDVIYGETVSGRSIPLAGIENAVGMFIQTIPVRVRFDETTAVLSLMKKRQEDYYSMQPFEGTPISEIGARTGLSSGLIKTLYIYENYPVEEGDYVLEPLYEQVEYDIMLNVAEEGNNSFSLSLAFNGAEYPSEYMELLLSRLISLSQRVTDNEEVTVGGLERVADEERESLLGEIAGESRDYPRKTCLDMIYEQVGLQPERDALIFEDRRISYREMWDAAGRIANRIGYGDERFVAVMADRSPELVIALTGIMLAGAAYVPLDPEFPEDRLRYILEDAKPEAVIYYLPERRANSEADRRRGNDPVQNADRIGTNEFAPKRTICEADRRSMPERVFDELSIPVIELSEELFSTDQAGPPMETEKLWNRIAYMLYTSGTTGNPKGVEIEHKTLSDMICSHEAMYGSFHDDRVLLLTNYVFDMSIEQMFVTLSEGGSVCIMPKGLMGSPPEMARYCKKNHISFLGGTNAFLRVFDPDDFKGIRVVSFCGDEADPVLFKRFYKNAGLVVNDYGPTEACVHATAHEYNPEEELSVPIGRPYLNRRIYILQGRKLCGIGQKGEICIAGGLARGYHNRKELTDRAFVENPFAEGRIYRTGDLGVFRPDGSIMYGGRTDSQVKVRGFRIELGEIESCIRQYEGVSEVLVLNRKDGRSDPYLCAYITGEEELDTLRLRQYLGQHLPYYMVPDYFVKLDRFPLNFNGKIDRKKLKAPELKRSATHEPPQNPFEERVAGLFERILGIDRAGRNDSFFELGGNSIDLMKLLSALYEEGVNRADIMEHPTPQSLGGLLMRKYRERLTRQSFAEKSPDDINGCVLLNEGDRSLPTMFFIPPSGGMTLCYADLIKELKYAGCIYGLTDIKYSRFGKMSMEELKSFDPEEKDLWHDTIHGYMKALERLFKEGDILIGYSQGGSAAHVLAGMLEKQGLKAGCLIMLDALPYIGDGEDSFEMTKEECLYTAQEIFFGNYEENTYTGKAGDTDEEPDITEFLRESLRAHGETPDDAYLHALYETYLVYASNMAFPLVTKERIHAPVYSILLTGKDESGEMRTGPEGIDPCLTDQSAGQSDARGTGADIRVEPYPDDPWKELSSKKGEALSIPEDENGHMTFLNRYRSLISCHIKEWITREGSKDE